MTTSSPPSCVLWIDGARYADGQPGEPTSAPVALTGLSVTWGRDTTIDQPPPATCTFTVLDRPGGDRFGDRLHLGARVQVRAAATIYPDPTVPTITDPGFETRPAGTTVSAIVTGAAPVTVTTEAAHTGAHAVRIDPAGDRLVRVIFPPADLSASHDPAAWDAVPRTLPGQTWRYGAAVKLPTALAAVAGAVVRPVTFTQPWDGPGVTVLPATAAPAAPDGAGWSVHSAVVTPPAGVWLGIAVDIYPVGVQWDQVPAGLTWDQVPAGLTWDDTAVTYVDDLVVLAPTSGAARAGEVFTGRITDLEAEYDTDLGGTLVAVTAQDDTAELGNRYVGAQPWTVEALSTRFGRILTAAGQTMAYTVDPSVAGVPVTYRDVDNQAAAGLLAELAQSVGGALWSATSLTTGPYLRLEDVNTRAPLQVLAKGADNVIRIVPGPVVGDRGITVSACDILLDPVRWQVDSTDSATRVALGWKDQAPDPVKPTDKTVTVVDTAAEAATGQRRVAISTQLAAEGDATRVAGDVLGRLSAGGWRISGLTYRVDLTDPLSPADVHLVMTVLDGTTRIGLPIMLTELPEWSPAGVGGSVPLYLEGGKLTNDAGAWTLDLVVSSAKAQGAGTVQWDQLPAGWTWDQFDPAIRWDDLRGVGI